VREFTQWWQQLPHHIDPVIFSLGPIHIRWYGVMYVVVFTICYLLVHYRIKSEKFPYKNETISDFFFWLVVGVLIGGRLGYVFFYDFAYFLHNPIAVISPVDTANGFQFTGINGMSYHGGLIGVVTAFYLFSKKRALPFWNLVDLFVPAVPLGYTFGRLGNFMNGELFGRVTNHPWGMYFPLDATNSLRHPSQLYEAFFEGIVLFLFLWFIRTKSRYDGYLFSLYLIGYGIIRFWIEFVREPDAHLGFIAFHLSLGQILCLIMILTGLIIQRIRSRASTKTK
jgi:phosphatidylglycerol:prolipoprotein diacylglycerol transferase